MQEPEDSEELLKPLSPTDEDVDKLLLSPPAPSPRKQERHHRRRVIVPKFALPGAVQEETDEAEKGAGLVSGSHVTRDWNTPEQVKQQKIIDEWLVKVKFNNKILFMYYTVQNFEVRKFCGWLKEY